MSNTIIVHDARVVSSEPFVRGEGNSQVTKLRFADNPAKKTDRNPARFFNGEAWGKLGEQLTKLSKGDVISITGELKLDKYTDKKGVERQDDLITIISFRVQKSESFFDAGFKNDGQHPPVDGAADDDLPF
jgi:single-stranded DNA-binding protein